MKDKEVADIFLRYVIIFLLGVGNLYIIYFIFEFLTINLTRIILSFIGNVRVSGNLFNYNNFKFILNKSCIAGAAYYLLLILVMSVRDIRGIRRSLMLMIGWTSLFLANILRIILLANVNESPYFDLFHIVFWHILSIAFVIIIWFSIIKIFKIKSIPFVDDFKKIKEISKKNKNPINNIKHKHKNVSKFKIK